MGNSASAPAQLSYGFPIDTKADVPVLPPFAALGLCAWCLILMKMERLRWLPEALSGLSTRVGFFVLSLAFAVRACGAHSRQTASADRHQRAHQPGTHRRNPPRTHRSG